ncbi:MAG TPA: hypothetical protein PK771_04690 [Spirochaetota bacterium]|nr:hypothetical protein [Spirochaetota bacterium]
MNKKFNDYKNSYSNNKNRKNDYLKDKGSENKKVLQEVRTISTSNSKEIGEKKKIQIIPRIKIFNNGQNQNIEKINDKNNQEKNKKVITVNTFGKVSKNDFKFKSKIPRNIIPYKVATLDVVSCPICNKNINNMSNSIKDLTTEIPCHFECVVAELKKKVHVRQNQRIAYVGSGSFAVIEDVREDGRNKFVIIQKLQYSSTVTE